LLKVEKEFPKKPEGAREAKKSSAALRKVYGIFDGSCSL
jgi:hypothetical protein